MHQVLSPKKEEESLPYLVRGCYGMHLICLFCTIELIWLAAKKAALPDFFWPRIRFS